MAKSKSNKKLKRLPGPTLPKAKPINPFSLHQNKKKFDILGQSKKGTKGLPGVSRQRAFDNRSKTLLVEYMNRNKNNVFMDKRLGQKDQGVDESQKMDLRRIDEVKKVMSKRSMYNLSDNADDLLTHGGVVLTDANLNMAMSDEELDEDGMLDAQFVKDQHFGGLPSTTSHGNTDGSTAQDQGSGNRFKSQQERMDEIIAESKKRKLVARSEKEAQIHLVSQIDSQYDRFKTLLQGNLMTEEDKIKSKKVGPMAEYHRLMRTIDVEGGGRAEATERLKSAEEVAREQQELLQRLEHERLERMKGGFEEQRPKVVTKSADSLDTGLMEKFEGNPTVQYRDGKLLLLDGAGNVVTPDGEHVKPKMSREVKKKVKKQARLEKQRKEEERRLREDMGDTDEEESDDYDEENEDENEADNEKSVLDAAQGEDDDEKEDEEESDEEDKYSDILEEEESGEEGGDQEIDVSDEEDVEDEEIHVQKSNKNITCPKKIKIKSEREKEQSNRKEKKRVSFSNENQDSEETKKKQMDEAKNELPFTYNVPADFTSFWSLLHERTPEQVSTILARMVATNHPKVKHENKLKCQDIFSYVLQTLHVLCSPDSSDSPHPGQHSALSYVDALVPHLYTIMKISPELAARAMLLVFIEKRDEYRNKTKKRYPYLDTMIFLQVSGLLFPASDFYHPVMTPIKTFLGQLLAEAKMKDARGVLTGVYAATLLHEYIRESSRFSSELVWRLQGLLMCCCPQGALSQAAIGVSQRQAAGHERKQDGVDPPSSTSADVMGEQSFVPLQWLVHSTLPPQELMQFDTRTIIATLPAKLNLAIINDDNFTMTNAHRCTVLLTVLKILKDLCEDWAQLPSIREVMSPLHTLLPLLPVDKFPAELVQMKQELETALKNLPPHPPRLRVDRGRPKPLRMLEPMIVEMKVNAPRASFSRSDQKELKQKLIHSVKRERKAATREIKKDTVFLARQKLSETLKSDAERKRKVNLIMNDLRHQEGEHIQYQKMKPGSR